MKKILKALFLLVIVCMCCPVFAADHNTSDLVAVGESATVKTDLFTYTEVTYTPSVPDKDYGRFNFQSITNSSSTKRPISVDILLFDAKKENIGFVTYCTDQDFGGEFAQKKLGSGASTGFYINVVNKYFVADKGPSDVMYFSIYDDNSYCHVGGYTKYEGLTIEEIMIGSVVTQTDSGTSISLDSDILSKLGIASLAIVAAVLIGSLISLLIHGVVLNALHKKMFDETTILAYLPIANQYVAVKLAFGETLAKYYVIAYAISIPLYYIKFLSIIAILVDLVGMAAFIYDIVKLISKDYKYNDILKKKDRDNVEAIPEEVEEEPIDLSVSDETDVEDVDVDVLSITEEVEEETEDVEDVSEEEVSEEDESEEKEAPLSLDYSKGTLDAIIDNMDGDHESDDDDQQVTNSGVSKKNNTNEGESDLLDLFR